MAETDLKVTVSLVDQITGKLKGVQDNLKGFSDNAKKVGTAFTGAGIAIGAAIGTSIKVASDFQSTMSNVSTLISGDSTEAIQGLSDGILEMTGRVPKSADELGAALYDVLSAGVQGSAEQLNVLEQSSKLAVAGLGDTKGAVGIMTSAINAFNLPAEDAGKISDILFKTVKNGKTTVDEMAQAFGASAPIVAAAGISLEEFSAATAALTTTGMPAAQAQNGLRQSVIALSKPTADMSKIFDELGFESGQAAIEQFGLVEVMKKVDEAADGNTETLGKAYGSVEAMGAAISLTGPTAEAFTNTLADMTDGANAVDEAFQKQTETFDSQMALLKNQFMGILITIGSELLPTITEAIKPLRENIGKWFEENKELAVTLAKVVAVIGAALLVLGPLLLALSALPALISGVGAAFTLATGPVGIITAAIALLIAGGILLYQNWDTIKEKIMAFLDKHPALMEALETAKETIKKVAEIIKEQFIKSWDKLMEALEPHKEELELIAKVLGGALLIALGTVALSIAALVLGISALILIGTT
ncbi:phage tail tape measure protein, partial [bacterium]|nr:phage tail tape measure protein [bacterium]